MITPEEFVKRWGAIQQKESSASHSHFLDVCHLVGHEAPADRNDPSFMFEKEVKREDGRYGRADVYLQHHFIWEYKSKGKNLNKAYQQLLLYRDALDNPPLLITSDMDRIIIHTNFTNRPRVTYELHLTDLMEPTKLQWLKDVFHNPERFKPEKTKAQITHANAQTFLGVAETMKAFAHTDTTSEQIAHFLVRILFCLFAEDMGLIPNELFSQMVRTAHSQEVDFQAGLQNLFQTMRDGGVWGFHKIPHFNGTLFDDAHVPAIPAELPETLLRVANQDWSQIDPVIFGTLFEGIIDKSKRRQLGAHYTSQDDILLVVDPVLMHPLRQEWQQIKTTFTITDASPDEKQAQLEAFAQKISQQQILDPACGSGNFLYVALQQLLDLQKMVISYAQGEGLAPPALTVLPTQLHGMELSPYAYELAQITVWIGYIQWRIANGFEELPSPILQPLHTIRRTDAIVQVDGTEPRWPNVDVIIGNPPFLGGQKLLSEFGDTYINRLRQIYQDRVPAGADLVAYWFEKARQAIGNGQAKRAGLLATQSIRGEASRLVLERIKQTGDIFLAWSDKAWVLDGAAVRISIVGFDDGSQTDRWLDGQRVPAIHADLTTGVDVTQANVLDENRHLAFMGIIRVGPFELTKSQAQKMLQANACNGDVVKRWVRGRDITDRPQEMWIIDFGLMDLQKAQTYAEPFAYVKKHVKPKRDKAKRAKNRKEWWLYEGRRSGMREALAPLSRFIATPLVAKHRLFVWLEPDVLPDARVIVMARDDDYFLGVLQSRVHEVWALERGARHGVGNDPTYNTTTCFASFPFPWVPGQEPTEADEPTLRLIAQAARKLNMFRQNWLYPSQPNGDVVDVAYKKQLKKRTLTNLYNALVAYRQMPDHAFDEAVYQEASKGVVTRTEAAQLDAIHRALDIVVMQAYGWPETLRDDELLQRLLLLNQQRSGAS